MNEGNTKVLNHGSFTVRLWDGSAHYDIKPGENFVPNDVWWRLNDLSQVKTLLDAGRLSAPALEPPNYPREEDDSQTVPEAANTKGLRRANKAIQAQGVDIEELKDSVRTACEETRLGMKSMKKKVKRAHNHSMDWLKKHITVGGASSEDIKVEGLQVGQAVMVMVYKKGATPRVLTDWVVAQAKITLNFDGDPAGDHEILYFAVN